MVCLEVFLNYFIWVRNYLFLNIYITSETAVSHIIHINSSQLSFYAHTYFKYYQNCPVPLNSHVHGSRKNIT